MKVDIIIRGNTVAGKAMVQLSTGAIEWLPIDSLNVAR
jgi:hypothetical protein